MAGYIGYFPPTQPPPPPPPLTINLLLRRLRPTTSKSTISLTSTAPIDADEIAFALSNIFTDELSPVQAALLLHDLSLTGLDQRSDVLAKCADTMRAAAEPVDLQELKRVVMRKAKKTRAEGRDFGSYKGGLCDIVGTGGDGHSTFNISTTSSILASSLLLLAKHGNVASTSKSGSADVLALLPVTNYTPSVSNVSNSTSLSASTSAHPAHRLDLVTPSLLPTIYASTNYAFLFAPNFHKGMRHAAAVRKELPHPSIFNILGPLANPVSALLEARVIGVKSQDLVDEFAEALRLLGAKKAMVVCGEENLDEISCAGPTRCARLTVQPPTSDARVAQADDEDDNDSTTSDSDTEHGKISISHFTLSPTDFGVPTHPLSTVSPGLMPVGNAAILSRIISNTLRPSEQPILDFVLINTAALFVISGVTEGEQCAFGSSGKVKKERGPGGGRWKEGVRLARLAVESGRAKEMVEKFLGMLV